MAYWFIFFSSNHLFVYFCLLVFYFDFNRISSFDALFCSSPFSPRSRLLTNISFLYFFSLFMFFRFVFFFAFVLFIFFYIPPLLDRRCCWSERWRRCEQKSLARQSKARGQMESRPDRRRNLQNIAHTANYASSWGLRWLCCNLWDSKTYLLTNGQTLL